MAGRNPDAGLGAADLGDSVAQSRRDDLSEEGGLDPLGSVAPKSEELSHLALLERQEGSGWFGGR
jgi:hypothetical protein